MKKQAFLLASISVFTFSCSKKETTQDVDLNKKFHTKSITYYENMEGSVLFPGLTRQNTTSYALAKDSTTAFVGAHSARFELRDTDAMNNNGTRSEVLLGEIKSLEQWYSFQVAFDLNDYAYDTDDEVIMQWHQSGSTPALCFRVKQSKIWLRVMGNQWYDLGSIAQPYLQGFIMHVKHASDTSGLIELSRNHATPIIIHGPNMYAITPSVDTPVLKLGIYKSGWNNNETTMTTKRVLYYDNVRVGDKYSTWDEFLWSY